MYAKIFTEHPYFRFRNQHFFIENLIVFLLFVVNVIFRFGLKLGLDSCSDLIGVIEHKKANPE